MNPLHIGLILLNTLMLVSGQFLWKFGLSRKADPFESLQSIIHLMFSPFILGGLFIYGLATVLWLFILNKVDISIAYPMQSIAYLITVIGAYYMFNEQMSVLKIAGCVVILIGVGMIGLSARYS
ncbi:EamA family transporter [Paenibacillus chitinolyticus]|uniref:EamA family transporter n=1 Tax=Paenibacillus chitinolyticus TaxID=79263 RepID=UPI003D05B468